MAPAAALNAAAADSPAAHFSRELSFLLGLISRANAVDTSTTVTIGAGGYGIALAPGSITLVRSPAGVTATFTGPLEAALRLVSGRLRPEHTPAGTDRAHNNGPRRRWRLPLLSPIRRLARARSS